METAEQVREHLRWQERFCANDNCPITGAVCAALAEVLDERTETGRRALSWSGPLTEDLVGLRIAAGLHALHRAGRAPRLARLYAGDTAGAAEAVAATLAEFDHEIAPWLDGPPQTNEPGRSAMLMTGLKVLASRYHLPLELLEIGSSAGLNLQLDRYSFDLGGEKAGPEDAAIHFAPEWRGPPPPSAPVEFRSIRGCDIAPVDVSRPGAIDRLLAYIWVDQQDRFEVMERALMLAAERPPVVEQADAGEWLAARLAEPQAEGTCRVLMHSIMWRYLPADLRRTIRLRMEEAGSRATPERPLGWIMFEGHRDHQWPAVRVRSWPDFGEEQVVAIAQGHGFWVESKG